jgi:glutamyl-tRNA synthetase
MDMGVTHVIRGDDHLNNTPRQVNMFAALDAKVPAFAHVPMILGPDGAKLYKLNGAVSVLQYEEEGYLPDALLNYLVRLGWSHGDQEIFTREEMIAAFDIADVNKAASAFNPEKLLWLNQQHLMRAEPASIVKYLRPHLKRIGIECDDEAYLAKIVIAQRERVKTLKEMAELSGYFFVEAVTVDAKAAAKHLTADAKLLLRDLASRLANLAEWSATTVHGAIHAVATEQGVGLGKVAQPLRVAVTGSTISPPIDATLEILGRDRTLARLRAILD